LITARVGILIDAHDVGDGRGAVAESHLQLVGAFHHMVVGDDVAVQIPDETGAGAKGQQFIVCRRSETGHAGMGGERGDAHNRIVDLFIDRAQHGCLVVDAIGRLHYDDFARRGNRLAIGDRLIVAAGADRFCAGTLAAHHCEERHAGRAQHTQADEQQGDSRNQEEWHCDCFFRGVVE
jgi:hypothetical protein